jgi:hypothetical protein
MTALREHRLSERVTLVVETCCNCGTVFALSAALQEVRLEDHRTFYCPAGHGQSYTGKTEAERERERAEQAERELADARTRLMQEREELRVTKRRLTTERRRTAAAVCPCCQRSFVQLRRHLSAKHPDYVEKALHP